MSKQIKILFSVLALLVLTLSLTSAMIIKSVDANNFQPGNEQAINIDIKNSLSENTEDVSLILDMSKAPFTVINSDEISEIDSDDIETLDFTIKASNDAKAGDYSIPYTLYYTINNTIYPIIPVTGIIPITGTFSLTVEANPELSYAAGAENPVVGLQGKIKFTIINKGLGDAKFLNVKIIPEGYTLLSDDNYYIGTINSDDSTTVSFDAIFNRENPTLNAQIEYKDFNNQRVTKSVNLQVTVYSSEEALKLGIIKRNNTIIYLVVIVIGISIWVITRKIRKKRRLNKSQGR